MRKLAISLLILTLLLCRSSYLGRFHFQPRSNRYDQQIRKDGRASFIAGQKKAVLPSITFTNYGWFQNDTQAGLTVPRALSTAQLVSAIEAHERFNRSAWNTSAPVYAFLDVETCAEVNWPSMPGFKRTASDTRGGRERMRPQVLANVCDHVRQALSDLQHPDSRLMILHCSKFYPGQIPGFECAVREGRSEAIYDKLVVAHLTAHKSQALPHDFGIPPLPIKPVNLTENERQALQACRKRDYLFSFRGKERKSFRRFHRYWQTKHGKEGVYAVFTRDHVVDQQGNKANTIFSKQNQTSDEYYQILRQSVFAAAPRGDNLFSYRFAEALSGGAIPVIYADGMVLPYTQDVVQWSDVAVILREDQLYETMEILKNISDSQICRMQSQGQLFYNRYVADSHARLRGIMEVLDSRLGEKAPEVVAFQAVPGDAYWELK